MPLAEPRHRVLLSPTPRRGAAYGSCRQFPNGGATPMSELHGPVDENLDCHLLDNDHICAQISRNV